MTDTFIKTTWPWLEQDSTWDDEKNQIFYAFTYGENWQERLTDGTDNDEGFRLILVFSVCSEYKLSLYKVWRRLCKDVFINGKKSDLKAAYIRNLSDEWGLKADKLTKILHAIEENKSDSHDLIFTSIHNWILQDKNYQDSMKKPVVVKKRIKKIQEEE